MCRTRLRKTRHGSRWGESKSWALGICFELHSYLHLFYSKSADLSIHVQDEVDENSLIQGDTSQAPNATFFLPHTLGTGDEREPNRAAGFRSHDREGWV